MAVFVVDASAALAWFFEDEANSWTNGLLERLKHGDNIVVPAHRPVEISNGLLVAVRRNRLRPHQPPLFWAELTQLPIEIEPGLNAPQAQRILVLCEDYNLTAYDAAYLELAERRQIPLATPDNELRSAASKHNVKVLS